MTRPLFASLVAMVVIALPASAERKIGNVTQPMSLLGTDLDAKPLEDEPSMAAMVVSRPCLLPSGIFEDVIAAVALPHHLAGADAGFPQESNLVILLGAKVNGVQAEGKSTITFDLSGTTDQLLKQHGVTLEQFAKLLVHCTKKILRENGMWVDQGWFHLEWKLPPSGEPLRGKLPAMIGSKS